MRGWPAGTGRLRFAARALTAALAVAVPVILAAPALAAPALASPAHLRAGPGGARPVVFVGIAGLRWTDVSAGETPGLWRLAGAGSPGTLVVRAVRPHTCAVDDWLTLNAGARATAPHANKGGCPPIAGPAALPAIAAHNQQFHYNAHWGLLSSAAGPGGCATAAGPGAALALAGHPGVVPRQVAVPRVSRSALAGCPLTVVDLGTVPAASGRAAALHADDAELGRIAAAMPTDGLLVVAGIADGTAPHLRPVVVTGAGYRSGLLATASTRQPGLVQLTDLTAAVLAWTAQPTPADLVGSPLTRAGRGSLADAMRGLVGQDTAAQVYSSSSSWFFALYAVGDAVAFGAILLLCPGTPRRRRRRGLARIAGAFAGAVVPASFLASVVPWWLYPHPAVMLYAMTAAWAAVIGAGALAGPWRRDPFGPAGVVGVITVLVIGLDVMTGSRLQIGTPFGLSTLEAGRFYGVGNNALGPYAAAGILAAAWLAGVAARRSFRWQPGPPTAQAGPAAGSGVAATRLADTGPAGAGPAGTGQSDHAAVKSSRAPRDATLAVAAVAAFTVMASGWPGFGSKFGGTVAMVPGFILLGLRTAAVRVNARRGVAIALSGVAAVALFALVNYFVPITGHSHIGAFVGDVLHGGAGGVLQRKISSNVGSLTLTPYSPLVPLVVVALGLLLLRPRWFGASWLPGTWAREPLVRPTMAAIWVVAVLGWLADDSGVTVAAAALPFALPLAIAIHAGVPDRPNAQATTFPHAPEHEAAQAGNPKGRHYLARNPGDSPDG
jgi:hypothetical protein